MKKKQFSNLNADKGFSLIRSIIVIGVIGIVSLAIVVLFDPVALIQKAMDSKRKSDLAKIQGALQQYYKDFGKYPPNPGDCLTDSSQCKMVRLDGTTANFGEDFNPYVKILPKDPSKNKTYVYYASGQTYYLYASLDRGGRDRKACDKDGGACDSIKTNGIDYNACGEICNYGVSSGNVSP